MNIIRLSNGNRHLGMGAHFAFTSVHKKYLALQKVTICKLVFKLEFQLNVPFIILFE